MQVATLKAAKAELQERQDAADSLLELLQPQVLELQNRLQRERDERDQVILAWLNESPCCVHRRILSASC